MRGQRFEEVLRNCREGTPLELTDEEKEEGWHYCPEDQGQLVLQRLVGGKPWCGCKLPVERGCTTNNNLNALLAFIHQIQYCKKFERVDGVPTLTVGPDMYRGMKECVDEANLCVGGDLRGHDFDPILTICGVVVKLEE